jgi:transcriptional regulator with XRE-family HTH domain
LRKDQQQRQEQVLKALGESVRSFRTEKKMTQEELAVAANLHRTYITDIESGLRNVSFLTLHRICLALQCSLSTLIVESENPEHCPN